MMHALVVSLLIALSGPAVATGAGNAFRPVSVVKECRECPEMVRVRIDSSGRSRAILVGRYELMWKEYLPALREAGCPAPRNRSAQSLDLQDKRLWDDNPMTSIRPDEIDCYLDWLNKRTGRTYRLPTEAEWMAIAELGSQRVIRAEMVDSTQGYLLNRVHGLSVRDDPRAPVASRIIQPVGRLKPNPAGLYDLFGNAAEMVSDREYFSSQSASERGKHISLAIVKGGSIGTEASFDLIHGRQRFIASTLSDTIGFRLVREND